MTGEVLVVAAKPDSPEVKRNQIGVEVKARMSDQQVYEAICIHKLGDGTVVLEVCMPDLYLLM
jgi:hypothetical protein